MLFKAWIPSSSHFHKRKKWFWYSGSSQAPSCWARSLSPISKGCSDFQSLYYCPCSGPAKCKALRQSAPITDRVEGSVPKCYSVQSNKFLLLFFFNILCAMFLSHPDNILRKYRPTNRTNSRHFHWDSILISALSADTGWKWKYIAQNQRWSGTLRLSKSIKTTLLILTA